MKKAMICAILLVIMTSTACAFVNEPLGVDGWAWGIDISSVAGWLAKAPENMYEGIESYARTDGGGQYLGLKWKEYYVQFLNGKFIGVVMYMRGPAAAYMPALLEQTTYGKATIDMSDEIASCKMWIGETSFVAAMGTYQDEDLLLFAGTPVFLGYVAGEME